VYGHVLSAEIALDRVVKAPTGWGFVEYRAQQAAQDAIKFMHNAQVDGQVVSVKMEVPEPARPRSPRRRMKHRCLDHSSQPNLHFQLV
jgi:RNA recognition motif-containing protein